MMTNQAVSALLAEAGIKVEGGPNETNDPNKPGVWPVFFEVEGKQQLVFAMLMPNDDYIMTLSLVDTDKLSGKPLDTLPAEVMRTLIRAASEVRLAKIRYQPQPPMYIAVSECSTDRPTAQKLRARMEACAKLAAKIVVALA